MIVNYKENLKQKQQEELKQIEEFILNYDEISFTKTNYPSNSTGFAFNGYLKDINKYFTEGNNIYTKDKYKNTLQIQINPIILRIEEEPDLFILYNITLSDSFPNKHLLLFALNNIYSEDLMYDLGEYINILYISWQGAYNQLYKIKYTLLERIEIYILKTIHNLIPCRKGKGFYDG